MYVKLENNKSICEVKENHSDGDLVKILDDEDEKMDCYLDNLLEIDKDRLRVEAETPLPTKLELLDDVSLLYLPEESLLVDEELSDN